MVGQTTSYKTILVPVARFKPKLHVSTPKDELPGGGLNFIFLMWPFEKKICFFAIFSIIRLLRMSGSLAR